MMKNGENDDEDDDENDDDDDDDDSLFKTCFMHSNACRALSELTVPTAHPNAGQQEERSCPEQCFFIIYYS